ncbi:MAG: ribbon-helix-helix protein, CopG family [Myxococcaceae bacterium]|nr:ribbon-helix-helix protein, CopG family [Myxococcaceae bacterium]
MRTTIDLNDELFRALKKLAATSGLTLKQVIEQAVRQHLGKDKPKRAYRLKVRPVAGRLRPGVRLEDRAALWDLMDGRA